MSAITVQVHGDVLVVDSRLIAQDLEVDHSDWISNVVCKYQAKAEQAFGILRFQNGKIDGRGRPTKFALLTEDQANFMMTLSRNTEAVVNAKLSLVRAFSAARAALKETQPQLPPDPYSALDPRFVSSMRLAVELQVDPLMLIQCQKEFDGKEFTPQQPQQLRRGRPLGSKNVVVEAKPKEAERPALSLDRVYKALLETKEAQLGTVSPRNACRKTSLLKSSLHAQDIFKQLEANGMGTTSVMDKRVVWHP